ncbi:MAG TPA: sugar transferase, partial [Nodosilinea sp.]|nr:sugar transferase [Nodosilinea sp.]
MAPALHCHRAVPAAMHQRPRYRQDLRAPRRLRLQLRDALTGAGRQGLVLLATDVFALGLSWHVARSLNQFFSP